MIKKIRSQKKIQLLILILFALIFSFLNLSKRKLEVWDEYTNFNVIYDTIKAKSFPDLKLHSNYFFEKPPLWYWITMQSTKLFGINNLAIRLPSALACFFIILLTYKLGNDLFNHKVGIISSFTLLSVRHLFIINTSFFSSHTLRSADLDSFQIMFLLLTSISLIQYKKCPKIFWLFFSSVFTSLGFLSKGALSIVPIISYFSYCLFNKNSLSLKSIVKQLLFFSLIFLLATLPWHIYMYNKFGSNFISEYFIYHMLERSISTIEEHYGKVFFFIEILIRRDFYFSFEILTVSIIYFIRNYRKKLTKDFKLFTTLSTTILFFLIPTFIQTKLAWYILPFYPYSSILIGKFIKDLNKKNSTLIESILSKATIGIIGINICLILYTILTMEFPKNII